MNLRHPRFVLFMALLAALLAALSTVMPWPRATVIAFNVAAFAYIAAAFPLWRSGAPEKIRRSAAANDGGRMLLLCIAATVVVVILVALTTMIRDRATLTTFDVGVALLTIMQAWLFANVVFTFHYAHLFYDASESGHDSGGLVFPGTDQPTFADFVYFSFVLGMTFQVSDVAITAPRIRRVATFHGLLAFFFNLGVLALTVNVLAAVL